MRFCLGIANPNDFNATLKVLLFFAGETKRFRYLSLQSQEEWNK